ncbi:hypothetical protein KAT92_02930, partial [Candidatus Babeliales bacterium]|nr:hypothetical protein [Candidatus Babeliales bacterium]
TRYTTQVLNEYIDRMDDMTQRLNALVERVHLEDEAAKAKSESEAKEKMSVETVSVETVSVEKVSVEKVSGENSLS